MTHLRCFVDLYNSCSAGCIDNGSWWVFPSIPDSATEAEVAWKPESNNK